MSGPTGADALGRESVAWIATVRPDGRPHVVPLWFLWDGESILVFSKAEAQKVRNLRHDRRVMVAVGAPGLETPAGLLEAVAELDPVATRADLPSGFVAKYRARLTELGLSGEAFAQVYPQPIRIRPTRWLDWGGPGWSAG